MKTLMLDTNFLMAPHQHRVDVFSEIDRIIQEKYDLLVPEGVIEELKQIREEGASSDSIAAKVALQLIEDRDRHIIKVHSEGEVDGFILDFATKNTGSIVCTNDKELKKRLRKSRVPVIHLRGRNRLELIN